MRWPVPWLLLVLVAALLVPAALPVAADEGRGPDGDGGDEGGDDREKDDGDKDGRDGDRDDGGSREGRGDDGKDDDGKDDEKGDGRGEGEEDRKGKDRDDEKDGKDDNEKDGKDKDERKERRDGRGKHGRGHGKDPSEASPDLPGAPSTQDAGAAEPVPGLRVEQDYALEPGVLTYLFTIQHDGPQQAADARLSGRLPAVGAWIVSDPRCLVVLDQVECQLGDLAPGSTERIEAQAVLVGRLPAFTNIVQVYTPSPSVP